MSREELVEALRWAKRNVSAFDEHQFATKTVDIEDVAGQSYFEGQVDLLNRILGDLSKEESLKVYGIGVTNE